MILLFSHLGFLLSGILFIIGLKKLGHPTTARCGNTCSLSAMSLAVLATLLSSQSLCYFVWIFLAVLGGSIVGIFFEKKTPITGMPELIALFNGFGGFASLCVALAIVHQGNTLSPFTTIAIIITAIVGAITFSGSIVAWGKLSQRLSSRSLLFTGQKYLNLFLFFGFVLMGLFFYLDSSCLFVLYISILLSLILGITLFCPIGGADMPVVIALLNSNSGLAASFVGFSLNNTLLILSGALVGASGFILTAIMCKAMNRSLCQVLFSAFQKKSSGSLASKKTLKDVKSVSPESASYMLESASKILIVPGYGLAVAQAQHLLHDLAKLLTSSKPIELLFAIHPVAGRMPGHMNVLLAEANISYESLVDMETINEKMSSIDLALVIGANDVVNPSSRDKDSSLYGMPIINVDKAKAVIVLKRSMATGFAGVSNPLFFNEHTSLLFGDAKQTIQQLITELKSFN